MSTSFEPQVTAMTLARSSFQSLNPLIEKVRSVDLSMVRSIDLKKARQSVVQAVATTYAYYCVAETKTREAIQIARPHMVRALYKSACLMDGDLKTPVRKNSKGWVSLTGLKVKAPN